MNDFGEIPPIMARDIEDAFSSLMKRPKWQVMWDIKAQPFFGKSKRGNPEIIKIRRPVPYPMPTEQEFKRECLGEFKSRELKPEYQKLADEFDETANGMGGCCSCHISPPCSYCTHPGNPNNLNECDEAWAL